MHCWVKKEDQERRTMVCMPPRMLGFSFGELAGMLTMRRRRSKRMKDWMQVCWAIDGLEAKATVDVERHG